MVPDFEFNFYHWYHHQFLFALSEATKIVFTIKPEHNIRLVFHIVFNAMGGTEACKSVSAIFASNNWYYIYRFSIDIFECFVFCNSLCIITFGIALWGILFAISLPAEFYAWVHVITTRLCFIASRVSNAKSQT